jgi:hypothetical protein
MPDEITVHTKSESVPASAPGNQSAFSVRTQLTNLCALGLGVSFFLPWANILIGSISGFDLQKAGDEQRLLWLIPILCVITIAVGLCKISQKIIGPLTGLLPFAVGVYWYCNLGNDMFQILFYGAYLSLLFGAGLFILPLLKSK